MGQIPKLLTFEQAAAELNVPAEALRAAADTHGKTIKIGRAIRVNQDDLVEIVRLCQQKPKVPASSGKTDPQKELDPPGSSETDRSVSPALLTIGKSLKKNSRAT